MNPVPSGGYAWVVFTSRRLYGNVATINPFYSDPRYHDLTRRRRRRRSSGSRRSISTRRPAPIRATRRSTCRRRSSSPATRAASGSSIRAKPTATSARPATSAAAASAGPDATAAARLHRRAVPACAQEFEKCTATATAATRRAASSASTAAARRRVRSDVTTLAYTRPRTPTHTQDGPSREPRPRCTFDPSLEESGVAKPRNDRNHAVTKFCLAMEEHRRTEAGRVRTAKEFVAHFFPYDEQKANDQLFLHMPQRRPRARAREVGHPRRQGGAQGRRRAGEARRPRRARRGRHRRGDLRRGRRRPTSSSTGSPLAEWWSFWRRARSPASPIQKALATARELGLIDDQLVPRERPGPRRQAEGHRRRSATRSARIRSSRGCASSTSRGDGSPAGIVAALGWETVLAKTAQDALLFALDQFARKAGLAPERRRRREALEGAGWREQSVRRRCSQAGGAAPPPPAPPAASAEQEPSTARHDKLAEAHPTVTRRATPPRWPRPRRSRRRRPRREGSTTRASLSRSPTSPRSTAATTTTSRRAFRRIERQHMVAALRSRRAPSSPRPAPR